MTITGPVFTDGLSDEPPSITITNAPEGTACYFLTITGPSPLGEGYSDAQFNMAAYGMILESVSINIK